VSDPTIPEPKDSNEPAEPSLLADLNELQSSATVQQLEIASAATAALINDAVAASLADLKRGPAEPLAPPYIDFEKVSIGFGDRKILDQVSFHVGRGQTLCILGRSGVGKSVSLKHIMGFLKADSGQIIVDGEDVTNYSEREFEEVRRKVTMVFQSGALFDSLTVSGNIAFPLEDQPGLTPEDIDGYVEKLAKMLEVESVLDKLPGELSTGMRRAVSIARALAQNPEAILYDEPTTMVDPIMAAHMGDLIARLKEAFHKTSIVVTHDTHLARKLADKVVFLQDGKSTVFNSWAEFENSKDPFFHNFLMQDMLIPELDVTL